MINILNKNQIKILHIADNHDRHNGRLYYSTVKKINNGLIKNDYNVIQLSDRDYLKRNIFNYKKKFFIKKLISTIKNFKPNIILFGHVDSLSEDDFYDLKNMFKEVIFSQWFLDTLDPNFQFHLQHKKRFFLKYQICDFNFITTDPFSLDFIDPNKTFFIPNMCDPSIDILENYNSKKLDFDLFFAFSHGQHRGILKKGHEDERLKFVDIIENSIVKTNFFGINRQPIWGQEFFNQLSKSKMGLNLNRGDKIKYYSSDRICSLISNGLLTFLQKGYNYDDFFKDETHAIYFDDEVELLDKIKFYAKNDNQRCKIAFEGKKKYYELFNNTIVTDFMIKKVTDMKILNYKEWMI